ncbi:MAG: glycosyltransferase family 2 protein [Actinobacteria bacterium]|nr:glycosyltransferase family 2 protein [Actinomycetota bacterium]
MSSRVTVVIPSVGRPSLGRALRSVLGQTYPVAEVIVVADTNAPIVLPDDDRIILLRNDFHGIGPARARQRGIDAAGGSVIALLDDDDEWYPAKLEHQLAAAHAAPDTPWIASSRMAVVGPGSRYRTWPRRLIGPAEPIADYLFRFRGITVGGAALQTSTLCFPTALAREIPWGTDREAPHDEPSWLIGVQRRIPTLRVLQLPEVLSTYNVREASVSRDPSVDVDAYIDWGLRYLASESPRVLGDYLCTSPVSAAVSAHSLGGIRRSVETALRCGRPGPFALAYAVLNASRIIMRSMRP